MSETESDPGHAAPDVLVVGAGPAGLMAAEAAAAQGARVTVIDAMPSPARKLLMAGKSGLNLTHGEPLARFIARYGADAAPLGRALDAFPPEALRAWAEGLGQSLFEGPSGRVFPTTMKASPLLRAWLARLEGLGVRLLTRTRMTGLAQESGVLVVPSETRDGPLTFRPGAVVLAVGGASWPRLGSDGGWTALLDRLGAELEPFRASNVGWEVAWSPGFLERFEGAPIKAVRLSAGEATSRGELVVTRFGLEGGGLYPLAPVLAAMATPALTLDLTPDRSEAALAAALARAGESRQSMANQLRRAARLQGVKAALLREVGPPPKDPAALAARIKALSLPLNGPRPIEEAISTAGGLSWSALDEGLRLRAAPGVFAAGEMIAWDAPTGGYLLTACFALGRLAGEGAARDALEKAGSGIASRAPGR